MIQITLYTNNLIRSNNKKETLLTKKTKNLQIKLLTELFYFSHKFISEIINFKWLILFNQFYIYQLAFTENQVGVQNFNQSS